MCHSERFFKFKSHTHAWRVVHTALLETEELPISLEFVFLLAICFYFVYSGVAKVGHMPYQLGLVPHQDTDF